MQTETLTFRPSAVRRKPLHTYKSPSGPSWGPFLDTLPRSLSASTTSTVVHSSSSSSSSSSSGTSAPTSPSKSTGPKQIVIRANPRLPLYHPNGTLALSLPPLDAAALGLPQVQVLFPISAQDDPTTGAVVRHRSSARMQRSASREGGAGVLSVSSIAAVAAREIKDSQAVKEKVSPAKKRKAGGGAGAGGSGGGGGGGKRKRKAVDDTDPTYPAKRTRVPRGGTQSVVADDDQETPGTEANNEPTPNPEEPVRTTRSRAKRRSSETPSSDIPASATKPAPEEEEESKSTIVEDTTPAVTPSDQTPSPVDKKKDSDKEEGELSDS